MPFHETPWVRSEEGALAFRASEDRGSCSDGGQKREMQREADGFRNRGACYNPQQLWIGPQGRAGHLAGSRIAKPEGPRPSASARWRGECSALRQHFRFRGAEIAPRAGRGGVAYDIMQMDGQDVRPEPLEERRKRLTRLLSRNTKAIGHGIQLSEAITGDGATIFRHAC